MRRYIVFRGLLLLAMCGSSKPSHPPRELSRLFATADRAVVTNLYWQFGFTVTGEEVGRLANAIVGSKEDRLPAAAAFDCGIEFYSGTNFLGVIQLQEYVFVLEDTQYSDNSGVLKTFYKKWLDQKRAALEAETRRR